MTMTHTPVDNGVNVEALLGVRDALPDTPEIAEFHWRAMVSWVSGTHSRSSVDTFYGFGEQQQHKTTFTYDAHHPLAFAAQDNGITPVEYVLVALGSCLTAGIASIAQQRKIQLRSVQTVVEADHDRRHRSGPPRPRRTGPARRERRRRQSPP
jgi:organic hydroperoxide reductase OsmC/OhrA